MGGDRFHMPSEEAAPHASGTSVDSPEGKGVASAETQEAWMQALPVIDRVLLKLFARQRASHKREDDGRCERHEDGHRCVRPGSTLVSDADGVPLLVCSHASGCVFAGDA